MVARAGTLHRFKQAHGLKADGNTTARSLRGAVVTLHLNHAVTGANPDDSVRGAPSVSEGTGSLDSPSGSSLCRRCSVPIAVNRRRKAGTREVFGSDCTLTHGEAIKGVTTLRRTFLEAVVAGGAEAG